MELSSETKTSSRVFMDQDGWYYEEYQLEGELSSTATIMAPVLRPRSSLSFGGRISV